MAGSFADEGTGKGRDYYRCDECTFTACVPRDTDEARRVLDDSEIGPGRTPAAQRCPTHGPMRKGVPEFTKWPCGMLTDGSKVRVWHVTLPPTTPSYYERTHPDGRVWCGWRRQGDAVPGPAPIAGAVQIPACPCCEQPMTPAPRGRGYPENSRVAYCALCEAGSEHAGWGYVPGDAWIPETAVVARRNCRVGREHAPATVPGTPRGEVVVARFARYLFSAGWNTGRYWAGPGLMGEAVDGVRVAVVHAAVSACPRCGVEAPHAPGEEPRCRPCGAEHRYLRPKAEATEPAWIAAMRYRHYAAAQARAAVPPINAEHAAWLRGGGERYAPVPARQAGRFRPLSMLPPTAAPPAHTGECVRGCQRTFGGDVAGCMHPRA